MKKLFLLLTLFLMSITSFADTTSNIMKRQTEIESEIENDIKTTKYTLDEPFIMTNPYEISPLTALVIFETEKPTKVDITILGQSGAKALSHSFKEYETLHKIPIYGLFEGKNIFNITITAKDNTTVKKVLKIETESANNEVSKLKTNILKKGTAPGFVFVVPGHPGGFASAYDEESNLRWYINKKNLGMGGSFHKLTNGHLLMTSGDIIRKPLYSDGCIEIDMMGKIYKYFNEPAYYHHEALELPDKSYLFAADPIDKADTTDDHLLEITPDGKAIWYNIGDILGLHDLPGDELYTTYHSRGDTSRAKRDWAHINAVAYDKYDDSILFSARHIDAIVKFDRKTKKLKWIITDPKSYWLTDELRTKLLKPTNKNFKYFYGQHGLKSLDNETILVYDNGCFNQLRWRGIYKPDKSYDPTKNITRGLELKVNEKNGTFSLIDQYKSDHYTVFIGDINKYGPRHYLYCFGGIVSVDGKDSDNMLAAQESANGRTFGIITEVKNGKIIYQAESNGGKEASLYRAVKMSIYKK